MSHKRLIIAHLPSGCWSANRSTTGEGYSRIRIGGKLLLLHRVVYEREKGAIPENKVLDHLCRNRWCCNPSHLEAVSQRENVLRGNGISALEAKQTHCKNGHLLKGNNLFFKSNKNGRPKRACRICSRNNQNKYYLKRGWPKKGKKK